MLKSITAPGPYPPSTSAMRAKYRMLPTNTMLLVVWVSRQTVTFKSWILTAIQWHRLYSNITFSMFQYGLPTWPIRISADGLSCHRLGSRATQVTDLSVDKLREAGDQDGWTGWKRYKPASSCLGEGDKIPTAWVSRGPRPWLNKGYSAKQMYYTINWGHPNRTLFRPAFPLQL